MFDNVSKTVKKLSTVLLIAGCIFALLALFAPIVSANGATSEAVGVAFLVGIVWAVCVLCGFLVASILVYGFGQLLENNERLVKNSEKILKMATEEKKEKSDTQENTEEMKKELKKRKK